MLVQLALALTLCIIATIQPLLMELAKRGNGGHTPFHTPSAVFYTEAIKLVIALCTWGYQARTNPHFSPFTLALALILTLTCARGATRRGLTLTLTLAQALTLTLTLTLTITCASGATRRGRSSTLGSIP